MVNVSSEYFRSNDKKVIEDSFKSFMSKYFGRGPSLAKVFRESLVICFPTGLVLIMTSKNPAYLKELGFFIHSTFYY